MTKNFKKFGLVLSLSLFAISSVVYAGTLTPSATPAATSYTLSDIYTRLTTNTSATLGNHDFTPAGSPAASLYTLTQIYDSVPTIDATKVKLGTSYLGIAGSLLPNYGTATVAGVFNGLTAHLTGDWNLDTGTLDLACNTATFNGTANLVTTTYDGSGDGTNRWCMTDSGDAIAGNILSGKVAWVDGTAVTGTMTDKAATSYTPSNVVQTIVAGYYNGSGTVATDANLVTGNIKSGITIFGVAGDSNVVNTSSGDAIVGDILSGKIAWVDGLSVTGTMPTQTLSSANDTVSAGYYGATTLSAVDTDLASGNILSGATIFGVAGSASAGYTYGDSSQAYVLGTATGAGTALKNLWNGTSGAFTGGSQANGGADDYNNGGAAASGRYAKGWTACNAGNSYCGTSDSGADAKDDSTGLIWSLPCNGSGCATFSDTTPITYSWDSSAVNNNSRTASQLCSDHAGWSLPHQKQSMQAYIDGSYGGNLEASGVSRIYWSATTVSYFTTSAWYTYLSNGFTSTNAKTNSSYVRCVR